MRVRHLTCLAGLGLLATTFACSSTEDVSDESGAAHTRGEIVWNNDPHGWADIDRAAFAKQKAGVKTAPEDHVTTARIQVWLDRYDAIVRAMVQESGQELVAPKPLARIVLAPDVNAAVTATATCIASAPAPADPRPVKVDGLTVLGGRRSTVSVTGFGATCVDAKNWTPESGVEWFNGLNGLKVVPGESAIKIMNGEREHKSAEKVAIRASAPFVDVNAGLIANLSERATAVILAHELAHYYRTHLTTGVDGKYDFWYDRDEHTAERPTPVRNATEYSDQYRRLKLPRYLVPGQKYHPRIAETLLRWTRDLLAVPGHVCEAARNQLVALPAEVRGNLEPGASDVPLDAKGRAALLALEPTLEACINGIELTDEDDPGRDFVFSTDKMPRAWFANRLQEALEAEVTDAELAGAQTLAELVAVLDAAGKRLDEQAPEFLKRLAANKIGHYTPEQEADELSMELASRVGIRPGDVMDSYIRMTYAIEKQNPKLWMTRQGMSAKECHDLAKTNFRDGESERKVFVSMGALENPHHAWCYRLLNLQREREAHSYRSKAPKYEPEPTPWKDIQAAAKKLIEPPAPETKPSEPAEPQPEEPSTTQPSEPPASDDYSDWPSGDDYSGDDYTGDESTPAASTSKKKASDGGCSAAPGSTNGSYAWMLGVAAALVAARRRRS